MKISALVKKSLMPLVVINSGIMLFFGTWLALQGKIAVVWIGFLGLMFSWIAFPFLLLPAAIFAGMMQALQATHPRVSRVMAALSVIYLAFILSVYAGLSFAFAAVNWQGIVYAAGAAVAPWAAFCLKDRGNVFFTGLVLMMQAAAAAAAVLLYYHHTTFWTVVAGIFAAMLLMLALQALYERFVLAPGLEKTDG